MKKNTEKVDNSQNKLQPLNSHFNKILYIRVSSLDQSLNRQQENLEEYDTVIEDRISGAVPFFERPGGKEVMKLIEQGVKFQLYVSHVDRCGRNVLDILSMINYCSLHSVGIVFYRQGLRTLDDEGKEDPIGRLIISVLLSIAEMQRKQIREYQADGIRHARLKDRSKYPGRREGSKEKLEKYLAKPKNVIALSLLKKGTYRMKEIAILSGLSINSVSKLRRIWNVQERKNRTH